MPDGSDGLSDPFSFAGPDRRSAGWRKHVSDEIEKRVIEFIRTHRLFAGAKRILLAVSGGADSIALLHIAEALRAKGDLTAEFACAHVNHQLRGAASDADTQFVVDQANRLRLPVATRTADVRAHAKTYRLSVETAARELRLSKLAEMAREHGCAWVATGHQKNDNAETLVHRLLRGTGFRGLAGIWPARPFADDLWLARPLLCLTRDDLVQYLGRRDRRWRQDHTNVDLAYTRNTIRHRLLPALQDESRGPLVEELSALAASARELYERIRREAREARPTLARLADGKAVIDGPALTALPEPVAIELVRQTLVDLGCREDELKQCHYKGILELARKGVGGRRTSLPEGFAARYESQRVILGSMEEAGRRSGAGVDRSCSVGGTCLRKRKHGTPAPPEQVRGSGPSPVGSRPVILQVPGETRFGEYEIKARILERAGIERLQTGRDKTRFSEYLDFDRVKPPVTVRARQAGDRFQPLGMPDEKKVGKFLTTAKLPRDERFGVLVLADREKIIWLCPVRISERAKVTAETKRILSLTATGPELPKRSKEVL